MSIAYRLLLRQKLTAFAIHVSISFLIVLGCYLIAAHVWYPEFYYSANSVWLPIATLAFVDVGLGPILTLLLYKPGKPGLKFDLGMIVVFQLAALSWGVWLLHSQRPALTVYADGSFYCLSANQAKRAGADLSRFPRNGEPVPLAFLPPPATPEERQARDAALAKLPPEQVRVAAYAFGDRFEPFTPEHFSRILDDELEIGKAIESAPTYEKRWEKFRARHSDTALLYAYFPLVCSNEEHLLAIDRDTGALLDAVAIPSLNAYKKRLGTPAIYR